MITEAEFESMDVRKQYRTISEQWHRFLQFPSALCEDGPPIIGLKRLSGSYWEEANREVRTERWRRMADTDMQERLETIQGPGACFRGLQEKAIREILHGASPIVVVMDTGAGKSLCFMLPASIPVGGTTVVVVPLAALCDDLWSRCELTKSVSAATRHCIDHLRDARVGHDKDFRWPPEPAGLDASAGPDRL